MFSTYENSFTFSFFLKYIFIFFFSRENTFLMTRIRTAKNIHIPQHLNIEAHKNIFVSLPLNMGTEFGVVYMCVNIDVWMCECMTMCTSICTWASFIRHKLFEASTIYAQIYSTLEEFQTCSPLEICKWTETSEENKILNLIIGGSENYRAIHDSTSILKKTKL